MTPRNLDELRDMAPGLARVAAAGAYIAERKAAIEAALAIRNADIRDLAAELGPAKTARLTNLSLSTVKLVKGQA